MFKPKAIYFEKEILHIGVRKTHKNVKITVFFLLNKRKM